MLTTLDLLNTNTTRIVTINQRRNTGEWDAVVLYKGQKYSVCVTSKGTDIKPVR